ncbi:MAG: VPLPA-CTERM sorting domain-containing protein [Gammaproteobacteria bacterium]|nr:VPLPA-CTERM sorting domain-containing protein [Gammaproteobacteria bacterium]
MFNKKYTKLVAAMGITMFAGVAQAANTFDIADNGGFETGDTSGWTVFGGGGVSTVNPSSGLYSGQGTCIGGPCDVLFKNANKGIGVAQAGGSITINFDYRGTQADGGVIFAELFSELDGGGVSKTELLFGGPLFGAGDVWQTASITTTLGADVLGGVTLQLKSSCGAAATCVSDAYFDNVQMLVEPVPVPAAVWLFGSGLLGLVGVARRKKAA